MQLLLGLFMYLPLYPHHKYTVAPNIRLSTFFATKNKGLFGTLTFNGMRNFNISLYTFYHLLLETFSRLF